MRVTFADGTIRTSFALGADEEGFLPATTPSCEAFASDLAPFRSAVDAVVAEFSRRLSEETDSFLTKPLLTGSMDGDGTPVTWDDVAEVVAGGEVLDHFHSYQKFNVDAEERTIEFHVDQGLRLAFSPGSTQQYFRTPAPHQSVATPHSSGCGGGCGGTGDG